MLSNDRQYAVASMRYTDSKQRIQTLFLQPADSYSLAEGARLLGVSPGKLKREAAFDIREEYRREGR